MIRCNKCVMPSTRPDVTFVDGVCPACITHEKRKQIDWGLRLKNLEKLLESIRGSGEYDCIVPSSGGKDSTYQLITLKNMGVNPLVVTASTCHLTYIGRKNILNLNRFADTYEVSPNKAVRARLNKFGLKTVGDISLPEHWAIFTTPFKVACDMNIPVIFYGENPQAEYGGPVGTENALTMTRRWRSEFGGFLGLRPEDMIGNGFSDNDMAPYILPKENDLVSKGISAHFLGSYIPWDSRRNAEVAIENGMIERRPCDANFWSYENLDNAQTGIHDYFMWLKFGFGRGCSQISVDIRNGLISRENALRWVESHDGLFPYSYGGILYTEVLRAIDVEPLTEFASIKRSFEAKHDNKENNPDNIVQG